MRAFCDSIFCSCDGIVQYAEKNWLYPWWTWKEFLWPLSTYGRCSSFGKYKNEYTASTKGHRMIFNAFCISCMWKGKLAIANDSETVEAEVVDADACT